MNPQYYNAEELPQLGLKAFGRDVLVHRLVNLVNPGAISLGNHVRIDPYVIISAGEPVEIGDYVHIGAYCYLAGKAGISMADFTGLSQGVRVYSVSDDYSGASLTNPTVPAKYTRVIAGRVVLERHVIIGANSVILPGSVIGEGSSVGALSLVRGPLPSWGQYVGMPARRFAERSKALLEQEQALRAEAG